MYSTYMLVHCYTMTYFTGAPVRTVSNLKVGTRVHFSWDLSWIVKLVNIGWVFVWRRDRPAFDRVWSVQSIARSDGLTAFVALAEPTTLREKRHPISRHAPTPLHSSKRIPVFNTIHFSSILIFCSDRVYISSYGCRIYQFLWVIIDSCKVIENAPRCHSYAFCLR